MWHLQLPVLCSPIPSYTRVLKEAHMELACSDIMDWKNKINLLAKDETTRNKINKLAKEYIESFHTQAILINKWEDIINELRILAAKQNESD